MFEGEMLVRILPTTLLQLFCKIILNFQVIVKSILNPDNNLQFVYFYRCSRAHPHPESSCTLLLPGMFTNFDLEQSLRDEYDQGELTTH